MSILRTVFLLGVLIGLADTVYGDIAPSRGALPKPPMVAPVKIVEEEIDNSDPNVVAKIIIPKSLLPDLQGSPNGARISSGSPPTGTVIAGLALTAAAISLIFVNKTSQHRKKAVFALFSCGLLVGIVLLANSFAPPNFAGPDPDLSQPQRLIVIEVQEFGHEVTLILPSRK